MEHAPRTQRSFARPVTSLRGRAVTVLGLGTHGGGAAAARWLAQQGAHVTVTDYADRDTLADVVASLADVPIARWNFGGHTWEDFAGAELVVVNPAVPPRSPWLTRLAAQGTVRLTSEIELFLERCPATVVGVTGTVGKSTTASLIAAAIEASGRRVWLGGNIGRSLLAELPAMASGDVVVLELSSFQLHHLGNDANWPEFAAITNLSPNHLGWHGDFANYAASKRRLAEHALAVAVGPADEDLADWIPPAVQRLAVDSTLVETCTSEWGPTLVVPHLKRNAALAATVAVALGVDEDAIAAGFARFQGLPHRFETLAAVAGRTLINDSKATTPAAVLAALEACRLPVWLLVGGQDKGGDWPRVAALAARRARGVALFGQEAGSLAPYFQSAGLLTQPCASLEEAALWCWQQSQAGDTILLSPGCASFDRFRDFAERGEAFRRWANRLATVEAATR